MIYTEREAKVVSAVWGTEFIKFLAVLVILLLDDLFLHIILVQFSLFFISYWCKTAKAARKLKKLYPPNTSDDLCLPSLLNKSS